MTSVDFDQRQQVEGYAQIVSASGQPALAGSRRNLGPDFRGPSEAAWTREWWLTPDGSQADVVWLTAPVPKAMDTTFTFIGESANLPENLYPPNQAKLYVDGNYALTFDLGHRGPLTWQEGDFALDWQPRQVHTTVDGYHRQFATGGCGGYYRLAVPAGLLKSGQPTKLRVVLEPLRSDAINWFAVRQRPDALALTPQTNADQISQLQDEVIHLKRIVGSLARRSYAELFPERLPTDDVIIYSNERRHTHPPDALLLQNGDLLVAVREASEHISADGTIVMVRSRDGGKTWGERQVLREYPGTDEREVSLAQLRDGTLLINYWPNPYYAADGRYLAKEDPTYKGREGGIYIGRSTDNGHTWTWSERPLDPAPYYFIGTSERILELESGRLLMAVYFWPVGLSKYGCATYSSDDKGTTWSHFSTMADVPEIRLSEPALIQTRSGRLISILRNETGPAYYQANSDDGGETWTPAAASPIPGFHNPASLVTLADGTVLCIYGSRQDPSGIYVVASYDDGETWDMSHRRVIRDDFPNMDIGYPSSVVMPDGRVLATYYFNMFGRFFLAGSFFRWERSLP